VQAFHVWSATFDGRAVQSSTAAFMEREPDGERADVQFRITATMTVPPWINGELCV
jgi:hypothetical protein